MVTKPLKVYDCVIVFDVQKQKVPFSNRESRKCFLLYIGFLFISVRLQSEEQRGDILQQELKELNQRQGEICSVVSKCF